MPWPLSKEQETLVEESAKISREAWIAGTVSLPSVIIAMTADKFVDGVLNNTESILNIWALFIVANALLCFYRQHQLFKEK